MDPTDRSGANQGGSRAGGDGAGNSAGEAAGVCGGRLSDGVVGRTVATCTAVAKGDASDTAGGIGAKRSDGGGADTAG